MPNIIQRNIEKLGKKFLENIEYEDLDYRGFLGETQSPTLRAGAVLVNDLSLWLQSSQGDYYRRWTRGGYFDKNFHRFELSDEGAEELQKDLQQSIEKEFPSVEILALKVVPNLRRRGWNVDVIIRDRYTGIMSSLKTGIAMPQ